MGTPEFRHQPPSLLSQYALGILINGVMRPVLRTSEFLGLADRLLTLRPDPMQNPELQKRAFAGFSPGSQDVFVMTYPKSGTNWVMQIAHQLIHHGKGEFEHIHDVIPWPDTRVAPGFMRKYAIPIEQAVHWKNAPERKRVIKTHFNWDGLPYAEQARYIAVIRDPKDVFVSAYFFFRDGFMGKSMPRLDTMYNAFVSGKGMGGSWAVNAASYWKQRKRSNVLILSFKNLKRDLPGNVANIARFLDINVSQEVLDTVCRLSSFDYMKSIDSRFHMGQIVAWLPPGQMIRKGAQGGASELLSLEQRRKIDDRFQEELKRIGCDLPYEEFADLAE